MKALVVMMLLVLGCAKSELKGNPDANGREIDEALLSYVESFEALTDRDVWFKVALGDMDAGKAGVCYKWNNGDREVTLNADVWYGITTNQKLQLVYHELGHCVLDRGHTEGSITLSGVEVPISIMRPQMFNLLESSVMRASMQYYENELLRR